MVSSSRFPVNVYLISLSAFFADLGYQIVIGGLSIFLVIILGAPVWVYGLVEALNFGVGSIFSYVGGRLSDRYGSKRISILGNSLIPILSFTGFFSYYVYAAITFMGGWWSRNFRSASRRMMLVESTSLEERTRAFGFLHSLDVGGGMIAAVLLVVLYSAGLPFKYIFLISLGPLLCSTAALSATRRTERERTERKDEPSTVARRAYWGVFIATALFGFSYYSIGFPILSEAQSSSSIVMGLLVFPIFLGVSSLGGLLYSRIKVKREVIFLGILGYIISALGTLGILMTLIFHLSFPFYYISIVILGFGTSGVETFEPSIVSKIIKGKRAGRGLGSLSFFRSIGMFTGNIVVGSLYVISDNYSYLYATIVALLGGIIVIAMGSEYSRGRGHDKEA